MKKFKILISILLIFSLATVNIACSKKPQKPAESENEPKPVPPVVDEIEKEIIAIIGQADLIPYYEKQISEKEKKNKEKIELQIKIGQQQEQGKKQQESSGGDGEQSKDQSSEGSIDKLVEFKPAPVTLSNVLMTEIIKKEMEGKEANKEVEIPDNITEIWHELNTKIMSLHDKWNTLESEASKVGVPQETIEGFEKALNNLTIEGTKMDYMNTLIYSNKLTSYFPDFVSNYKKKFPVSVYQMKYHVRQVVLDSANKNFTNAEDSLNKLKLYKDTLIPQLIEKKLTEPASKLSIAVNDLGNAVKLQDINIIKIKASIVMKNINQIKEELSK